MRNDRDDDEVTPQLQPAPRYMADPFGPGRDPTDPIVYMSRVPSERAQQIMAAVMREAGDAAPMQMVATMAARMESDEQHLCALDATLQTLARDLDPERIDRVERVQNQAERNAKRTRAYLWRAAGVAGTLLASAFVWFLHTVEARGAEEQERVDQKKVIDELKLDIREVRSVLHRLGMDGPSSGGKRFEPGPPMRPPPETFGRVDLTPFARSAEADLRRVYASISGRRPRQAVAARAEVTESARVDQARALDVGVAGLEAGGIRGGAARSAGYCDRDDEAEPHVAVVPQPLLQWLPAHIGPEGFSQ